MKTIHEHINEFKEAADQDYEESVQEYGNSFKRNVELTAVDLKHNFLEDGTKVTDEMLLGFVMGMTVVRQFTHDMPFVGDVTRAIALEGSMAMRFLQEHYDAVVQLEKELKDERAERNDGNGSG